MSDKIEHPIYKYFKERYVTEAGHSIRKYRCNDVNCSAMIKWTGTPQNLANHLEMHSPLFKQYSVELTNSKHNKRKADAEPESSIISVKRPELQCHKPSTILSMFNASKNSNIKVQDSMALTFIMNGISVRVADSKYFSQLVDLLRTEKLAALPDRRVLRTAMIRQHSVLKEKVITHLKGNNSPTSLLLDGWTNVNKVKITNLLLVSRGVAYYWCSISNKDSKNNAEWLYQAIKTEIELILEHGIAIVSYVADNEAVMTATHNKLVIDYPFLIRIPCAAHTIQLAVKKILANSCFSTAVAEVVELINLFIKYKAHRLLLHSIQPQKTALRLIRPCDTRWSYTLFAIQRVIKLRSYIEKALRDSNLPSKSSDFWLQLDDLVTILTPFSSATNVIQQDSATLFDVGVQFKMLLNHANSLKPNQPNIALHITTCISDEWNNHTNQFATIAAAILSAAPNLNSMYEPAKICAAQEYVLSWGMKFLAFYEYSNANDVVYELTSQFIEFGSRTGRFIGFQNRIDSTKVSIQVGSKLIETIKPINVWQTFSLGAPELASVAIAILSICASEAAVERSFSIQDRIHSKIRNRSKDDLVEAQVFVKFNTEALNNVSKNIGLDEIEINEDCNPTKVVELLFLNTESKVVHSESDSDDIVMMEGGMQEEEEEHEQEEDEEEVYVEEEKIPAPVTVVNQRLIIATEEEVNSFLRTYIEENRLTKASRLVGDRENALQTKALLHNPRITTTVKDLKRLIKSLAPAPMQIA